MNRKLIGSLITVLGIIASAVVETVSEYHGLALGVGLVVVAAGLAVFTSKAK